MTVVPVWPQPSRRVGARRGLGRLIHPPAACILYDVSLPKCFGYSLLAIVCFTPPFCLLVVPLKHLHCNGEDRYGRRALWNLLSLEQQASVMGEDARTKGEESTLRPEDFPNTLHKSSVSIHTKPLATGKRNRRDIALEMLIKSRLREMEERALMTAQNESVSKSQGECDY